MKNETATHSKRYYIFKHNPKKPDVETVEFRGHDGRWSADFDRCELIADHGHATVLASALKRFAVGPDHNVCIGEVDIVVNGMFMIELVK